MSSSPHQPPFYNVFSSFQWKMPLLPRPPAGPSADAVTSSRTENPSKHRQNYTSTSANVPITDQTSSMNRKAPPPPPLSPHPSPPQHSHSISTDSNSNIMGSTGNIDRIVDMGSVSMSTQERETMKFNKRPGTVKLIPTTTPVTCVEDLQKILLPTKLNNLGRGAASASLLALSNANSSSSFSAASKMKKTGGTGYRPPIIKVKASRSSSSKNSSNSDLSRQNVTPCYVDYVPYQQDIIIMDSHQQHAHQASPVFQRLLQQYATAYQEWSTVIERRKAALRVMRAVQARGGTFLCSLNHQSSQSSQQQQWAVVSNTTAERFIARVLEQVARKRQPAVSKMARTARILDQQRAPVKKMSQIAAARSRAAVQVILHRHPIAPPRPTIKIVNKEAIKNKKLALINAVATLTKPVVQKQQQQATSSPPRKFQKKQRRASSVAMKPSFARPPIEKRRYSDYQEQLQASAAALELYTATAELDEPPRRVSWDKATIEAQRRAQQHVQIQQHLGYQGRTSSVFNALDLLSSAAILDEGGGSGTSSRSNSMSSSSTKYDEASSEESLSVLHVATAVTSQQYEQEHQEPTGSLLKRRRELVHRAKSNSSVAPVVNNHDDARVKAELSYLWN